MSAPAPAPAAPATATPATATPGAVGAADPRTGGAALDLVASALLSGIALAPLWTTFAGIGWLVVGGLGLLIGPALLGWLCRRPWGPAVAPLAVLLAYVVLALPISSRDDGLAALLPTSSSLGDLTRATGASWQELIGTLPLVDSTGPPLLVPLVLTLLPSASAAGLALATRSPVAPVLPPLAGLAGGFLLGRGDLVPWLAGAAFAIGALAWISLRGARLVGTDAAGPTQGHRRSARSRVAGLIAMLAVAALVGGLLAARTTAEVPQSVLRENLARGFDTTAAPTLLTGFRRYTRQGPGAVDNVFRRPLLAVRGAPRGTRLRFVALDTYDGTQWRPNPDTSPTASQARFLGVGSTLDNPGPGDELGVQVDVRRGWRSDWVPMPGALQEIDFEFRSDRPDPRDDLRYNLATDTAVLPRRLGPRDDYYVVARVPDDALEPGQGTGPDLEEGLFERADFVAEIADGFRSSYADPVEALLEAAAQLRRQGRYSDGASGFERRFPEGHGVERLGALFLYAPQIVGNDEQYAAAMALIATRMGFPARVVVGAVVPRGGVVRGRHVSAWVEVQVADGSWRTLATRTFMSTKPPKRAVRDRRGGGAAAPPLVPPPRVEPGRTVPPAAEPPPPPPTPPPAPDGPDLWWLLLLGLVGAVPSAKLARRERRRRAGDVSARFAGGWQELVDAGRDVGVPVPPRTTRPVQARDLVEAGLDGAGGLAVAADDRVFGVADPTPEEAAAYWSDVLAERRTLLGSVPRWRRVVAWFDPRSLWRR